MNNLTNKGYSNNLLKKVKTAILKIEPNAEIFLFGSRARGDYNEESDWDLLIILPGKITYERRSKIVHVTNPIELEEKQVFSRIYYSMEDWKKSKVLHGSPFYHNLLLDAVRL